MNENATKISNCLTHNGPPGKTTAGVYRIPCKICPKFYIGETGRSIQQRMKEHQADIIKPDPNLHSGVVNHVHDTGHFFDFQKMELLFTCNDVTKRHLVESALIKYYSKDNLTVNLNSGFSPHNIMLSKAITELIPKESL